MKKLAIILFSFLFISQAHAQTPSSICVKNGSNCVPVNSSAPLPIGVYDTGNHSGFCYTSNGSGSPATFQACGGGGGGSPGGVAGNIQYNGGGTFAGTNSLFWDNTNGALSVGGPVNVATFPGTVGYFGGAAASGGYAQLMVQDTTASGQGCFIASADTATDTNHYGQLCENNSVAPSSSNTFFTNPFAMALYNTDNELDLAAGLVSGASSVNIYNDAATTATATFKNPAASTPALLIPKAPFTGGTGTTTLPLVYLNSGTSPTTLSTSGTMLGANAPSGFAGNLIDLRINGAAPLLTLSSTGNLSIIGTLTASAGSFNGRLLNQSNGAASSSVFWTQGTIFSAGTGTTNFPQWFSQPVAATAVTDWSLGGTVFGMNETSTFVGNYLDFHKNGATSVYKVGVDGLLSNPGSISTGTKFTTSGGGCTVTATTGGATAGTFTTSTTGPCTTTITMNGATGLTAPNGWSCFASDITSGIAGAQTASTATTATLKITTTTGDTVNFGCNGF